MSEKKIICLTGLDRCGKATQSKLLQAALQPSVSMTFPQYGEHWAAEFVRAALNGEKIVLRRAAKVEPDCRVFAGPEIVFEPKKHPEIFQMWQTCDRLDAQPWIRETLKTHHIIADRYDLDSLAFGMADGCRLEWLLAMTRLVRNSDLAIVLVGSPYPRPGEIPDLNERDTGFQQKVREIYDAIATLFPQTFVVQDVDRFRNEKDPLLSVRWVHETICDIVRERLGLEIEPLTDEAICERLPQFTPVRPTQLSLI